MTLKTIGVFALQGDVREHLRMLDGAGARGTPVRRPEDLEDIDGIVLPGGESTTMSRLLDIFALLTPLRERIAAGLPVYGSCAGMILLATKVLDGREDQHQLGGLDMIVRRNAFGRQVDSFEADLDMTAVDPDEPHFHAVFIRAPWVERVGDDVDTLARIVSGPAAGRIVAVRQGSVIATSFHPEMTGDDRVHRYFVELAGAAAS